jgi:hypothetical protein
MPTATEKPVAPGIGTLQAVEQSGDLLRLGTIERIEHFGAVAVGRHQAGRQQELA